MATYRKGSERISICYMSGKKKPCLLIGEGSTYRKVASFDDDEGAELFTKTLEYFLGIKERKWTE